MRGINQYKENISKLIDSTKNNKLEWNRQNPTTFYFSLENPDNSRSVISVQLVEGRKTGSYILFEIVNSMTEEAVLSLDSSIGELSRDLAELYDEVKYSVEKRGIDLFNDIINSL